MLTHDRIVIGASAGGIEALSTLIGKLPVDLPAAIFAVVHFPSQSISVLPRILNRARRLPAEHAADGEPVQPGRVYVAPPDRHLLVRGDRIQLVRGPREHGFRPAIDPLFRSAAQAYGPRSVGVILSGTLSDGVAGMQAIKNAGGVAIVQEPVEALFPGLPLHAIEQVQVDYRLSLVEIASTIDRLAALPVREKGIKPMVDENEIEASFVKQDMQTYTQGQDNGNRTVLTCPGCGGVIWELQEGELIRFRCHVGHAYSADSLLVEQGEALEGALWTAVRALEERAALLGRLATQALARDSQHTAGRFQKQAEEAERQADVIRRVLLNGKAIGMEVADDIKMMEDTGEPSSTTPLEG
jgi:two-component system chemotaxis response regulator CheB